MEWYQWLTLVGIPSIISGMVALLIQRGMKSRDDKQEELKLQNMEMEKQNKAIMLGVQAILRDRLLQGYRYFFQRGWAEYTDRENLENLYKQYHALGANGIMDGFRQKFLALPITKNEMEEIEK